jgi:hypothetical protein
MLPILRISMWMKLSIAIALHARMVLLSWLRSEVIALKDPYRANVDPLPGCRHYAVSFTLVDLGSSDLRLRAHSDQRLRASSAWKALAILRVACLGELVGLSVQGRPVSSGLTAELLTVLAR